MVESINAASGVNSTNSTASNGESKSKVEDDGLFEEEEETTSAETKDIDEDTAKSTALSYIESLKAQYPQIASKLDTYYSHLDIATLLANASSVSDIKAYIFNETQGYMD